MVWLERGKVKLEEQKEEWKREYREEVSRLNSIIGDKILNFEHIGSTAINEVKAKPIIDMIAVVKNPNELEKIVKILEKNGYEHRPNGDLEDRTFLAKGPEDNRTHYLSLTKEGSDLRGGETTSFRDYLNSNPKAAKKYNQLKKDLAKKYSDDREKYTEEKGKFIEKILENAMG